MAKKMSGLGKGLGALMLENSTQEMLTENELPINEIIPNRDQPRKTFDEAALEELAESIKQHGVLQPLLVRPIPSGGYQLVAGERRWRACRMAGLNKVPVVIKELTDTETMEIAIIENLQREDLNPIEEAEGLQALIDKCGYTQEEVAASVGKSRPAIANSLRLLRLPQEVRDMTKNGEISAALLSDTFAYSLVQEGKLKCIRSLLDEDFADEPCCVIAMNATFVKENPTIAKKVVQCVQKAHQWMRENPEEASQVLIDEGMNSGDLEMNTMLNNSLQFGLDEDFTSTSLRTVVEKYIRLGLITATDDVDAVMEKVWTPVLDE